jgi:hypothetical protein
MVTWRLDRVFLDIFVRFKSRPNTWLGETEISPPDYLFDAVRFLFTEKTAPSFNQEPQEYLRRIRAWILRGRHRRALRAGCLRLTPLTSNPEIHSWRSITFPRARKLCEPTPRLTTVTVSLAFLCLATGRVSPGTFVNQAAADTPPVLCALAIRPH